MKNHTAAEAEQGQGYPYYVGLFLLCFAFSYLDRQVVSILVQQLKVSLSLSDTEIGMLQGLSFTLCYATAGVFVARLVDRSNRVKLIAVCVAIWAVCTAMCASATTFPELLLWRAGTAVAEAALSPAVLSLFADFYTPKRLGRPTGVFMLGPYLGSGIALIVGGTLIGWLQAGHMSMFGWTLESWQWVFLLFGLSGLPLAALVATTVREPSRRAQGEGSGEAARSVPAFREVLRELLVHNRFCMPYFFAYASLILLFYSLTAWFPTVLIRHFNLPSSEVGQWTGAFYMAGGVLGALYANVLARRAKEGGMLLAVLKIPALACAALVPLALIAPLVNFTLAAFLYGLCAFAASIVMALAPIPLQIAIPNRMRGRSLALLVFMTNFLGGGIGPFLVGSLSQRLGGQENGLGLALAGVGAAAAAIAALLYAMAAQRVSSVPALVEA